MRRTTPQDRSNLAQAEREARAWGWVAHLRDGGTTPWSAWGTAAAADEQFGWYLPGAQQLELLRRLNQLRLPSPELAERVLRASAPGRGRPDLGLVGVLPASAFGPPPVDPADLPADELVRVATALIAEDTVAAGDPPEPRPPRLLRRRYRLLGDPGVADSLRDALIADGRPPGGRGATVIVAGTDLSTMLVNVWAARSVDRGIRPWPEWLATVMRRRDVPDRIDLPALAEAWVPRVGTSRVHVVLDDPTRVTRLAGVRRRLTARRHLSADAVELARRTAPVVGMLVTAERRTALMRRRLQPVLAAHPGPPLRTARRHCLWLEEHTADLRRRLSTGGYAVHGTLPAPAERPGVVAPDEEGVLALAMQVLLGPPIGTTLAYRPAEEEAM